MHLHVTLLTVYKKETAIEAWLDPAETYIMDFFAKTVKLLALGSFLKKVLSYILGMVLNTPLNYFNSIYYYNTDGDNTALHSSESK